MSGADFAGALTAGDEYPGRDAEVEALAEVIAELPESYNVTDHTDEGVTFIKANVDLIARAILAAGYTRRPAAPAGVPVEALRELADEWDEAADKWPYAVWYDNQKALVRHLRALLPTATTDGGES